MTRSFIRHVKKDVKRNSIVFIRLLTKLCIIAIEILLKVLYQKKLTSSIDFHGSDLFF